MLSVKDLGPNWSRSIPPFIVRSCRPSVSESYLNCLVWSDLVKMVVSLHFSRMTHSKTSKGSKPFVNENESLPGVENTKSFGRLTQKRRKWFLSGATRSQPSKTVLRHLGEPRRERREWLVVERREQRVSWVQFVFVEFDWGSVLYMYSCVSYVSIHSISFNMCMSLGSRWFGLIDHSWSGWLPDESCEAPESYGTAFPSSWEHHRFVRMAREDSSQAIQDQSEVVHVARDGNHVTWLISVTAFPSLSHVAPDDMIGPDSNSYPVDPTQIGRFSS